MADYWTVLKKESKALTLGLAFLGGLILIQAVFKPSTFVFTLVLLYFNLAFLTLTHSFTVKRFTINAVILIGVTVTYSYLGTLGIYGAVAGILLAVALVLAIKWRRILEAKYTIEKLIWGERLKDIIARGERPPKIKITGWRK